MIEAQASLQNCAHAALKVGIADNENPVHSLMLITRNELCSGLENLRNIIPSNRREIVELHSDSIGMLLELNGSGV